MMPTVLVVDDLLSERVLAAGLLTQTDEFTAELAQDGREAVEKIQAQPPDLVLTDLQMPEMDGLELVGWLRRHYPEIPTILMTARGSESHAYQALRRGAASYVPKKFLEAQLLETVKRIFAGSSTERTFSRLMERVTETTFSLENDLDLISALVAYLRQNVARQGIYEKSVANQVATCLDEALVNAYYHGNLEVASRIEGRADVNRMQALAAERVKMPPYSERRITISAKYAPTEVKFVIRDEGQGFNPDELPDPTDPENLGQPCGRGLMLIRHFMDEVSFNSIGNEITMVKRRQVDGEDR